MRYTILALIILGITFWLGTLCNNTNIHKVSVETTYDTVQCITITTDLSFEFVDGEIQYSPKTKTFTSEEVLACYKSMLGQKNIVDKLLKERTILLDSLKSLKKHTSTGVSNTLEEKIYNISYDAAYDATH